MLCSMHGTVGIPSLRQCTHISPLPSFPFIVMLALVILSPRFQRAGPIFTSTALTSPIYELCNVKTASVINASCRSPKFRKLSFDESFAGRKHAAELKAVPSVEGRMTYQVFPNLRGILAARCISIVCSAYRPFRRECF